MVPALSPYRPADELPRIPVEPEPEPAAAAVRAVKAAYLNPHTPATPWVGIGMGTHYASPDAVATCNNNSLHKPPVWECSCGFYAIGSLNELAHWRPDNGTAWELEVALWGRVVEHTEGYRAERQRVVRARPPRWCDVCGTPYTPARYLLRQPGVTVRGACERHALADRSAVVLAGELEELTGVPIECPASMRDGLPPPDVGALLERLVVAVESGALGGGGYAHNAPPFPKEWAPWLETLQQGQVFRMNVQNYQRPADYCFVDLFALGDSLELRWSLNGIYHVQRFPIRLA